MNVSDLPDEVKKWLMEQKQPYAIFSQPKGHLTLVSGSDIPRRLWEHYHHGNIQSWLEGEGKERPSFEDYEESWIIPTENPAYDVAQIAEFLGVPKRTIHHFVKHASMPHFRVGSKLKFRLFAVMQWWGDLMRQQESRRLASQQTSETE